MVIISQQKKKATTRATIFRNEATTMGELHSLLYSSMTLLSTAIIIIVWAGTLPSLSHTGPMMFSLTSHWPAAKKQPVPIGRRIEVETKNILIMTRLSMLKGVKYERMHDLRAC